MLEKIESELKFFFLFLSCLFYVSFLLEYSLNYSILNYFYNFNYILEIFYQISEIANSFDNHAVFHLFSLVKNNYHTYAFSGYYLSFIALSNSIQKYYCGISIFVLLESPIFLWFFKSNIVMCLFINLIYISIKSLQFFSCASWENPIVKRGIKSLFRANEGYALFTHLLSTSISNFASI